MFFESFLRESSRRIVTRVTDRKGGRKDQWEKWQSLMEEEGDRQRLLSGGKRINSGKRSSGVQNAYIDSPCGLSRGQGFFRVEVLFHLLVSVVCRKRLFAVFPQSHQDRRVLNGKQDGPLAA
jgi:hypothetical protein